MSTQAVKAVLFDFGGVLAEEGFRNGLTALAIEHGMDPAQLRAAGMDAVYDSGFVLGRGSAEDFWTLLHERTGLKGDNEALTKRLVDGFIIRPWMIDLVRDLRERGYITAILSDQTHWLDELDRRYGFYDAFDHVYNSYYLGKGKRDPSLFADVATDLALPPSAILFVDDDAGNVARARAAGFCTVRFDDQAEFVRELERAIGLSFTEHRDSLK